jgi:hypothetical protein
MALPTPDWLAQHDGELRPSKGLDAYTVHFAGLPQYVLAPAPAKGKYACRITQTINGLRLDDDKTFPTAEDAIRGGLEKLRDALGW